MACFRRLSSLASSLALLLVLHLCFDITCVIIEVFHAVGIHFSDKHLVYSLASVFDMVYYPAFNVSMFIWSYSVAVPFFINCSTASLLRMVSLVHILGQC